MSKKTFLILLSHFLYAFLTAQIGYQLVSGASSLGMGGVGVTCRDEQAIFHNSSGLASVKRPSILLCSEMRFGITELRPIGCAWVLPVQSGVLGLIYQNFRIDTYHENKIGLAYGRKLSPKFDVGVRLDYGYLKIDEYGSKSLLNFEIGANSLITKDLVLAISVFNPISMKINEVERTPSVFRVGLAYTLNSKLVFGLETEKNINFQATYKFGLAYKLVESFILRCGFSSFPAAMSFGLGYKINEKWAIDCAFANHSTLGLTSGLSLGYFLK